MAGDGLINPLDQRKVFGRDKVEYVSGFSTALSAMARGESMSAVSRARRLKLGMVDSFSVNECPVNKTRPGSAGARCDLRAAYSASSSGLWSVVSCSTPPPSVKSTARLSPKS